MNPKRSNTTLEQLPQHLRENLTQNLCVCHDVSKQTIIHAILDGAHSIEAIKQKTYATAGNQCCTQQIEFLLTQLIKTSK